MRKLTPFLLAMMLVAFGALVTTRFTPRAAPPANAAATEDSSNEPQTSSMASHASTPATASATKASEARDTRRALGRPLRTIALGWEFLAPGISANEPAADGAVSAFKTAGLDVSFANATTVEELESALAKGGGETSGADIALMPLSTFVGSYERLRALSPEVVFVVGWSRGREAVYGTTATALARLPHTGTVKLSATAQRPETFMALFLLDLAGVPASRVELVGPNTPAQLTATFRAAKQTPSGKLIVTSADTPYLMPIVAVAPRGLIATHGHSLELWARGWLDGAARLRADVPAGARLLAAQQGAPQVVGIIEALGQIEFANLRENAIAAGLSGRGALTLDENFRAAWRIWRDAGVLTTPPPEVAPLYPGAITALVRSLPAEAQQPVRAASPTSASGNRPPVLLVVHGPAATNKPADRDAWIARVGLVASVFDRLPLRVGIRDVRYAQQVADASREQFNLRQRHIAPGRTARPSTIEVLSAP